MTIENPTSLKEKVDALEKTLLAICNVSDIAIRNVSPSPEDQLSSCAHLLEHLIEPAMYQVEALRMMIDNLPSKVRDAH